ncbi:MAG TPA: hypothetical protein VK927_09815 [Adhaeribacter sp.]|nr:hypothetical protein [Adhaeribacter sp.]
MKSDNKNKIGAPRTSAFSQIERVHPAKMLLYLCLAGIGIMFILLLLAYARTEARLFQELNLRFPKFFSVSTLILLVSTYTVSRTTKIYRKDKLRKLSVYLGFTLLLGLAFILSQAMGWYELANNGILVKGQVFGSYLYLLSAVHALHLVAGVLFLMYFYFKCRYSASDPVRTLIFIRDPFRLLQLQLLSSYWYFLTGLWVVLYLVFLFLL